MSVRLPHFYDPSFLHPWPETTVAGRFQGGDIEVPYKASLRISLASFSTLSLFTFS